MIQYQAPIQDINFVVNDLLEVNKHYQDMSFDIDYSHELAQAVIYEMAKFAEGVLLPVNQLGDQEGCHYDPQTQTVKAPPSYHSVFQQFVENGWTSLSAPVAFGGQGMPHLINTIFDEICASANTSLSMYFGLTHGAITALHHHADVDLKSRFLKKLVSGEWTGTMCLTEPHCGTDLGLIKTKAVPVPDGGNVYSLTGSKIWITGGEHDLVENIIHLVLAKLPDAPEGSKGISLFVVPKIKPDGKRNTIFCTGLEHKMGINGSATCFINLENAEGYLIGEPHHGLAYMFTMMNSARIMVGVQGLGLGEAAYQTSLKFARERVQGRSLSGAKQPDQAADNIMVHPDVRRMLLDQKVMLEGMRALAYWVGMNHDLSEYHKDPDIRQQASDRVELLTPVVKAFITDRGYWVCDQAVQTLGGAGYTKDWGIEQLLRDCRIARIYEGTNGIQALDLVGRKLPMNNGRAIRALLSDLISFADICEHPETQAKLRHGIGVLSEVLAWLARNAIQDRETVGAAATPLLKLVGLICVAYLLAKSADVAQKKIDQGDDSDTFLLAKVKSRDYFFVEKISELDSLRQIIKSGKDHLMSFSENEF